MAESEDERLLGYAELHCHTERALFSGRDINRLLALAGKKPQGIPEGDFIAAHAEAVMPLVREARERMREERLKPARNLNDQEVRLLQQCWKGGCNFYEKEKEVALRLENKGYLKSTGPKEAYSIGFIITVKGMAALTVKLRQEVKKFDQALTELEKALEETQELSEGNWDTPPDNYRVNVLRRAAQDVLLSYRGVEPV